MEQYEIEQYEMQQDEMEQHEMEQERAKVKEFKLRKGLELFKDNMYALSIGTFILEYVRTLPVEDIVDLMDTGALCLLETIKSILEKDDLNDPECFHRIEAIINTYEGYGIGIKRHDY